MAINFLHKRSNTANKRPTAANLDIGELALNYDGDDPGVYFEDDNGDVRKVGPVSVGASAPNSSPATGGSTGNSVGEQWLDTSGATEELKVWDGTQWVSTGGGGSGTPGGADTQVQFNNAGSFDGNANFTYNSTDDQLTVGEVIGNLDGSVRFTAQAGEDIDFGEVVYISGASGDTPIVSLAQSNSSSTMPAYGFAAASVTSGNELQIVTFGSIEGNGTTPLNTSGETVNDVVYVSPTTAGAWTTTKPTGEGNLLQNIGRIQRVQTNNGVIKVGGAGRTNATPNLDNGNIFIGDSNNEATTASFATTINTFLSGNGVFISPGAATFNGDVSVSNQEEFRMFEQTTNGTNYIAFRAPSAVTTTTTFDLPDGDGTNGQVLTTNGSQVLSWQTPSTTAVQLTSANSQQTIIPNDTLNNWFFSSNGAVRWELTSAGAWVPATDSAYDIGTTTVRNANIYSDNFDSPLYTVSDNGEVRYYETSTNGSNFIAFKAPASVTADTTFTLPDGDGTSGQFLATNGSGTLSWASAGTASLTNGNIFVGNASGNAADVSMSGDVTIDNTGATTIANDAVTTAKILDDAVTGDKIADSVALAGNPTATTQTAGNNSTRIATTAYADAAAGAKLDPALTSAEIFVGNASNVATGVAMSGDATIDNAGAVTIANSAVTSAKIADDTIVNADINSSAAIDYSKLASMTSGNVLLGNNSNVPTVTAISGDVTLSDTGVVDIIDDVNLGGNPTTTTQADSDNSTRIATTAFVRTRVDNAIQGLSTKNSVLAATTTNITLSGTQTVDGVGLSAGDRVLVKNQTDASENGIYVVASGAWSRASDANDWDELVGAFVFVEAGTQQASSGYVDDILPGGTLGTDDIDWIQFSGAGQIDAGAGMTKNGNILDVGTASTARIVVNADDIDLATTGVAAGTYRSVTTDTYGRITSGTNPTTFAGYGISDTSANLASAITDETGTGSLVFAGSPALTGTPTAPTPTAGTNDTTIATTAYADSAVAALSGTYVALDDGGTKQVIESAGLGISDGTDENITLGANGSAKFATNRIVFDADGHISTSGAAGSGGSSQLTVAGSQGGNGGRSLIRAAVASTGVGTGTNVFDLLDNGDLKLNNVSGATNITLNGSTGSADFAGSATFAGGKVEINANGSVISKPTAGSAFYAYNGGTSSTNAIVISNTSDGSGIKTELAYDGSATFAGNITPSTDGGANLGSTTERWANVYTQDMHFSNEGSEGNSIDGTTGDWTLQEGADNLYLINNKTGNKFRISMEPVD